MTAHIWACPPSEGDDYIFHCHPEEQKIPKPKRLTEWYRKMLDTAKSIDYKVICDYRVSVLELLSTGLGTCYGELGTRGLLYAQLESYSGYI